MDLLNSTGMQAAFTQGVDKNGRESLVVVVKGTFRIPLDGSEATLAEVQKPLVMADTFTSEPGYSAPVYEADFSPIKPRCDVLLVGSAHAPKGEPVTKLPVGLKVGSLVKSFNVIGDREWEVNGLLVTPGRPRPFLKMSITYDRAYGGNDNFHFDPNEHSAFMANPIGIGYRRHLIDIAGTSVPNTEEMDSPITSPKGEYRPMSLGVVGRHWQSRAPFAGTYDQHWIDNVFPFLPSDFDNQYFQAAPPDQQIPYLLGGEEVVLGNLAPQERIFFRLPKVDVPIVFFYKKGGRLETSGVIDTLVIEPDEGVFTLCWRASLPLKKNMFEITQVLTGKMSRGWWRARELGKTWQPSLAHLVNANKAATEEDES
ncbi:MAG: DUF2169 domain-containing protein [Methylococcales bacterium]|nr:DUF2169 domain-containing protein [Methylococcaceae bacterium]